MDKINRLLYKFESDYNAVDIFAYRKTSAWVRIKDFIFNYCSQVDAGVSVNHSSVFKFLCVYLLSIINFFITLFYTKKKVLYIGAGSGLFTYNDKVYDSYFPYRYDNISDSIIWLSADYVDKLFKYRKFLFKNHVVIFSYIIAPITNILILIVKPFIVFKDMESIQCVLKDLKEYNITINMLKIEYAKFIVRYWIFKFIFYFYKPELVYLVSSYTYSEICAVFREKGIPVIELQHGIIGRGHRAYNYAIKNLKLPTPDYVNVYSDFWMKELLTAGYYNENQIKITGRLKYELLRSDLFFSYPFFVFTGQGVSFYEKVIDFFSEFERYIVKKGLNLKMVYLPHPNESKFDICKIKAEFSNSVSIIIGHIDGATTEEMIKYSIAHISVYSSCHFDSVYFHNKTYIFDIIENNIMDYYCNTYPDIFTRIKTIYEIMEV